MSRTLHVIATFAALISALFIADAWRTARKNATQLTATLATQNALIQQAAAQEQKRNAQLSAALASIAAEKKRVQTPQQAVEANSSALPPLPLPVRSSLRNITRTPKPSEASPAS